MRVTQGMLNQQMLFDLNNNLTRISQLQNEASTGKRINTPSDDPIGAGYVMQYNSELSAYKQYQSNATAATGSLSNTDSVMNQAQQVMKRARDLAVQGASGTLTTSDRANLASEVDQLYQQMVTIGNSQYNGQYIFNGQMTNAQPYPSSGAENASTNQGAVLYNVGDGVQLNVSTPGNKFFGASVSAGSSSGSSDNAFALLSNLSAALKSSNTGAITSMLSQFDSRMSKMSAAEANVGALQDRVQFEQSRVTSLTNSTNTLLAGVQDADMATTITNLTSAQSVEQAALSVGAKIIVPTLVSFLN